MIKKIIAVAGAAAVLAASAGPALGWWGGWHRTSDVDVANVNNTAISTANTGGNSQNNDANATMGIDQEAEVEAGDDRNITTGNAYAGALAVTVANTDISCGRRGQDPCPCPDERADTANVNNTADALADTGMNTQDDSADALLGLDQEAEVEAGHRSDRNITTGDATSRAWAFTVVNTDLRGRFGH